MAGPIYYDPMIPVYNAAGYNVNTDNGRVSPMPRDGKCLSTKADALHILKVIDRQDAANKFTWYRLPDGLTSQMVETLLYYKGQLCFFHSKELDQFFLLPCALDGPIDVYGRWTYVKPLPLGSTEEMTEAQKARSKVVNNWLDGLSLKVIYEPLLQEDIIEHPELLDEACVLLYDYSHGLNQTITPRAILNSGLLDLESDMLPFLRTALLNSTGVCGVKTQSADEAASVIEASHAIDRAAMNGEKYVPVTEAFQVETITDGSVATADMFLQTMQSLDNLRLETHGLENGGLFQKRERMIVAEQAMNGGTPNLVRDDGVSNRQNFCDIVNSIWWFLDLACVASETASMTDNNGDGRIGNDQDQSGVPGEQPTGAMEDNSNE